MFPFTLPSLARSGPTSQWVTFVVDDCREGLSTATLTSVVETKTTIRLHVCHEIELSFTVCKRKYNHVAGVGKSETRYLRVLPYRIKGFRPKKTTVKQNMAAESIRSYMVRGPVACR